MEDEDKNMSEVSDINETGEVAEETEQLFSQRLVAEGLLEESKAQELADQARVNGIPFIIYLEQEGVLESQLLANLAAQYYDLPLYDLSVHDEKQIPQDFLELEIVEKQYGLPILQRGGKLVVAIIDPDAPDLREIGFMTGLKVEFVLVAGSALKQTIDRLTMEIDDIDDIDLEDVEVSAYEEDSDPGIFSFDVDDTPVVRFVNKILIDAIRSKSSDIHFEPYEKLYRIRYRQDGILLEVANPPTKLSNSLVARLKVMANLDISEHRIPQDGRFKLTLSKDQAIDFRISTCPTLYGEKVVMRILDPSSAELSFAALGFAEDQLENYQKAISCSQGIILVTGPTGSGKTVSLYSALRMLNKPERNVSTIEDPVEIYMQGINQVQVNNKTGMTFSIALRSFLRQDPDVIMVGEIRDIETAEIAVKAAQTGHLVLSTLHTNSAPETIARLVNMGVKSFNIASAVILVMAQRLVRRLCPHCKQPVEVDKEVLLAQGFSEEDLKDLKVYGPGACSQCNNGYKGRVGIYEVMPISKEMAKLIATESNALELADQENKEGIKNLRQSGLEKVKEGSTSLEELNRVINF